MGAGVGNRMRRLLPYDFVVVPLLLSCQLVHAQPLTKLEKTLTFELPKDSPKDGRWVFYRDRAEIERIDKPLVRALIPEYEFYRVRLTNYLGYHVNESTCLVLFNEKRMRVVVVEPEWYSGMGKWLKMFIGFEFRERDSLMAFVSELQDLMMVGSSFDCVNTTYSDSMVSFGIANMSATTTGPVSTSYSHVDMWRQVEIRLAPNNRILSFASINDRSPGDTVIIK